MKEFVEKLIERLEEYPHAKYKDDYGKGFSCAINLAIKIVNQLAEEYNQDSTKKNQGWILCSERLPEIDNKAEFYPTVIVTKNKYGEVGFGFHDGDNWYVFNDYTTEWYKYKNIKAWQPLPSPYKPKSEENNL